MANLVQSAALGFQTAAQQPRVNALGQFIKNMLATQQQTQALRTEYGMKLGVEKELAGYKAGLEKQTIQEIIGGKKPEGGATWQPSRFTYGGITFESPEYLEQKAEREIRTAQEKKAEETRAEMTAVDNMAIAVWDAANRLIPAPEIVKEAERKGIERKAKTISIFGIRPQRAFGISDEDALAFEQIKRGEATPLIRALGEKGMLTNQDIQRALELMPGLSDSKKLRQTKKQELSTFLKSKIKAYYKTETVGGYQIGQTFIRNGKQYEIVGFDTDGEPLVEPLGIK